MAAIFFMIGAWLRSGIQKSDNFSYVIFGSALIAASSPFFVLSQSIISKKWFPDHQQKLATAITQAAIPLGILASSTLTGLIFGDKKTENKK